MNNSKILWLSVFALGLLPWIYSTAKLFLPLLYLLLFVNWRKELLRFPKRDLVKAILTAFFLGLPMIYVTLNGMAGSRFSYISIFTDPTVPKEVNFAREFDTVVRGENQIGAQPNLSDKFFHNKFSFWTNDFIDNYISAISSDFLFIKGDPNLRHSPKGVGEFYWLEMIALLLGLIFFFAFYKDRKIKLFIAFWIVAGIFPAALTREGGNHAPRLILILPPLIFLITYGIEKGTGLLKGNFKKFSYIAYLFFWFLSILYYLHNYFIHYPYDSERWWNSGYKEMITQARGFEKDNSRIIITTADEPPLIFFAAYYPYDPVRWQKAIADGSLTGKDGGKIKIGKYEFDQHRIENLGNELCDDCLYVAAAREVEYNLIMEPGKLDDNLKLVRSISLPSGEPAFYFIAKNI